MEVAIIISGLALGAAIGKITKSDLNAIADFSIKSCRTLRRVFYRVRWAGLPLVVLSAALTHAEPNFITPEMTYRRGLTDEQYEHLWRIGRNPRIEPAAARQWMFRSYRFGNTTNWLNIVGKTNDFAKLSYTLQDENFKLVETNEIVKAENRVLVSSNFVLEVDAKKAQKVEKSADKAKKKDQKNFEKWVSDTEKAKKKSSEEMAEFYDAVLELANAYEEGE